MWSYGEPIAPSPTIDQAINCGFPWLEIQCSRCKTPNDVDLAALKNPPTTFVHDLASRLRCRKCAKAGRRPSATLLQLGWQPRPITASRIRIRPSNFLDVKVSSGWANVDQTLRWLAYIHSSISIFAPKKQKNHQPSPATATVA
jgi:hypothetical protein